MVVETSNENLNINELICEKTEVIFVEGEMIVPDSKPDILNTINTSGNICVYKKELLDEKLRIDGSVNAYIMYFADNAEDNIRGININLDFSENISIPNCKPGMLLDTNISIKSIDCNVINGRKIGVKVGIEVSLKVYSNEEISIINEIRGNSDIQVLENSIKVNSLVGSGTTKTYVKDTITIDSADSIAEILKANISLVDSDIKISYNKILAKTEADIKIMYLTEEGKISTVNSKIPIVGFVDIQKVTEENICDVNYEIKNLILKPNNVEEHSFYIEIEAEVSCLVYEERNLNLIQDLYSTNNDITFTQKAIQTMAEKCSRKEVCNIREKVNIPELEGNSLIDVNIVPTINKQSKLNSRIMYEGEIEFKFMFSTNSAGKVISKTVTIPFEFAIENVPNDDLNVNTQLEISNSDFIVQSGGDINCSLDLTFNVSINKIATINIIENVEAVEASNLEDYSLIVYLVKPGDTLWEIAKKFKSTVDDIARVNGIENTDVILAGSKLYIPKTANIMARSNLEYA